MTEEGVVTAALETDELDAATLTADAVRPLKNDPDFRIISDTHAKNIMFLEFDYEKPPFNDRAFRHALSYAIDRKAILEVAFGGYGTIALSPLSRGISGYDDAVANEFGTPYDPAKAKQFLAEDGWKLNGDNVLEKNGKTAHFNVRSYADTTTDRALAVIQANFAAIGVKVDVSTGDWGTFYPSLLTPDWDMDLNRWTWADPSVLSQLFRSPGHRKLLPRNPAVDGPLDAADSELDPKQRMKDVSEAQRAILQDSMVVPILTDWTITVTQKGLEGYRLDYLGYLYAGDLKKMAQV